MAADFIGWVFFCVGFLVETLADKQKYDYRNESSNDGHWCDDGLWKWSRHPNYFGEFCVWIGIWLSCIGSFHTWDFFTIVSPLYIILVVMLVSGPTRLEESADKRYWSQPEYQKYKKRTSNIIPMPPALYGSLSKTLKSIFCCDCGPYWNPQGDVEGKKEDSDSV